MAESLLDDILRRVATERAGQSGLTTSSLGRATSAGRGPLPAGLSLAERGRVLGSGASSQPGTSVDTSGMPWYTRLGWWAKENLGVGPSVAKQVLPGFQAAGAIDLPRRAIASTYVSARNAPVLGDVLGVTPAGLLETTVRKVNEKRGGGVEPEGRPNVFDQSWVERFKNPEFGYGQIFFDSTKGGFENAVGGFAGRTLDKVTGFTGDVAMDPLTYVSGSTTNVAGKLNRYGVAVEAAVKGLGDDVVRKASTQGAAALDDASRAVLNVPKAGLRFGNPFGG